MAAPLQQQIAQPQQNIQQQPVQQSVQLIQQPQYVQQTQVVSPQKTRQGCCSPVGKLLPLKFRSVQFGLGICMIINGFTGIIFGIVGIFTAYGRSRYWYNGQYYYSIYPNPSAWVGANIWAGLFVSFGILQKIKFNHTRICRIIIKHES